MTPHFLIWSFGPKIGSVDGICHQTDSMDRFYLDVETGPYEDSTNNNVDNSAIEPYKNRGLGKAKNVGEKKEQ